MLIQVDANDVYFDTHVKPASDAGHALGSSGFGWSTLYLTDTGTSNNEGPILHILTKSASPADNDIIGKIYIEGRNDAGEDIAYAWMQARMEDVSDGSEDGRLDFYLKINGSDNLQAYMNGPGDLGIGRNFQLNMNGTAQDSMLWWDGNAQEFYIGLDDGTDTLYCGTGSTVGSGGVMTMDGTAVTVRGVRNNTVQPSNGIFKMLDTAGGNGIYMGTFDSTHTYASYIQSAYLSDSPDAPYNLILQPDGGNVSIGTTAAASFNTDYDDLIVGSGSGNAGMFIYSGNTSVGALQFHDAANTNLSGFVSYDHNINMMYFGTQGLGRFSMSGGLSPIFRIGLGQTYDAMLRLDGNAVDFHIGIDDTDDSFRMGTGTTLGSNTYLSVGSTGIIYFTNTNGMYVKDDVGMHWGTGADYRMRYESANSRWTMWTNDTNGSGSNEDLIRIDDGQKDIDANSNWVDNAFDDYDDALLLAASKSPTAEAYDFGNGILKRGVDALVEVGVLREYEDGWIGYNDQRMAALLAGGIYQTRQLVDELKDEISKLKNQLKALGG